MDAGHRNGGAGEVLKLNAGRLDVDKLTVFVHKARDVCGNGIGHRTPECVEQALYCAAPLPHSGPDTHEGMAFVRTNCAES